MTEYRFTEAEIIEEVHNELLGELTEGALTPRSGAELGLWLKQKMFKITKILAKTHKLSREVRTVAQTNGTPQKVQERITKG